MRDFLYPSRDVGSKGQYVMKGATFTKRLYSIMTLWGLVNHDSFMFIVMCKTSESVTSFGCRMFTIKKPSCFRLRSYCRRRSVWIVANPSITSGILIILFAYFYMDNYKITSGGNRGGWSSYAEFISRTSEAFEGHKFYVKTEAPTISQGMWFYYPYKNRRKVILYSLCLFRDDTSCFIIIIRCLLSNEWWRACCWEG